MKVAIIGAKISPPSEKRYRQIKDILDKYSLSTDYSYFDTNIIEDSNNLTDLYKKNKNIIFKNTFLIAEITHYSNGIGYLIAEAVHNRRPVLALHDEASGIKPSNVIQSNKSSKWLDFQGYTEKSLERVISEYLQKVKLLIDTKFILNLPAKLDRFLEFYSYKRGVPKSHIVREAIRDLMEKNKDFVQENDIDF